MVGLSHKANSLPDELSGGEQQRVSIARAFVNHPPLLVCDEPTGNLDPDTSVGIMQLLYRINRSGTTVLMVTHDREMVDKMRKRVIQLEEGRLARDERRGGYYGRMRFRLLVSEAWRSLGANISTTFAATVTVLVGMFLLGLFIALGTLDAVVVGPRQARADRQGRLQDDDAAGDPRAGERASCNKLAGEPVGEDVEVRARRRRRTRA